MRTRRQRGFTLVELMVVIVVAGILWAVAAVALDTEPDLRSVTNQVKARIAEAQRAAVAGGPVRADLADAEGFTARARVFIETIDGVHVVAVQRRVEGDTASVWRHLSRTALPRDVQVGGLELGAARLQPGGEPDAIGDDGAEILCEPSGSCGPATLYIEGRGGERTRVAILPFAGAPLAFDDR